MLILLGLLICALYCTENLLSANGHGNKNKQQTRSIGPFIRKIFETIALLIDVSLCAS